MVMNMYLIFGRHFEKYTRSFVEFATCLHYICSAKRHVYIQTYHRILPTYLSPPKSYVHIYNLFDCVRCVSQCLDPLYTLINTLTPFDVYSVLCCMCVRYDRISCFVSVSVPVSPSTGHGVPCENALFRFIASNRTRGPLRNCNFQIYSASSDNSYTN
jgi:hypothetical protein